MANQAAGDVIEATATSTPAQGQGNREARRKAAAAAKREAAAKAKAEAAASTPDNDSETPEVETVVVPSKPAKAAFALGRGLRKVGRGIIDTDLRDVGHGVKHLKRFVPVVHVEKRSDAPKE